MIAALLFLAALPAALCARLRLYEASSSSARTMPPLPAVATICAADVYGGKFTLECQPDAPATSATFFVDGEEVRTERVVPYVLSGDSDGFAAPWPVPDSATVRCRSSNGDEAVAMLTFSCPDDPAPMPMPMPTTRPPTTSPPTTDRPMPSPPTTRPPTTAAPAPAPAPEPRGGSASGPCVRIPATSFVGSKSPDWVSGGGALAYKPDDFSTGVDDSGDAPLMYKFRAPKDGRYVISIDMKTENGVDHNDVWVKGPAGGVSLEKPGSTMSDGGWVKAYHNQNGRATEALSVDFNGHVISTKAELKAGTEYTVGVAGRSTRVTFYAVVMFPCSGTSCGLTDSYRQALKKCTM